MEGNIDLEWKFEMMVPLEGMKLGNAPQSKRIKEIFKKKYSLMEIWSRWVFSDKSLTHPLLRVPGDIIEHFDGYRRNG